MYWRDKVNNEDAVSGPDRCDDSTALFRVTLSKYSKEILRQQAFVFFPPRSHLAFFLHRSPRKVIGDHG